MCLSVPPHFIQLTNENVYRIFGVKVETPLFPKGNTSLSVDQRSAPAFLCPAGIVRMAQVYKNFPEDYRLERQYLEQFNDELTGLSYLKDAIDKIK